MKTIDEEMTSGKWVNLSELKNIIEDKFAAKAAVEAKEEEAEVAGVSWSAEASTRTPRSPGTP